MTLGRPNKRLLELDLRDMSPLAESNPRQLSWGVGQNSVHRRELAVKRKASMSWDSYFMGQPVRTREED